MRFFPLILVYCLLFAAVAYPCSDGPPLVLYGYFSTNWENRELFDELFDGQWVNTELVNIGYTGQFCNGTVNPLPPWNTTNILKNLDSKTLGALNGHGRHNTIALEYYVLRADAVASANNQGFVILNEDESNQHEAHCKIDRVVDKWTIILWPRGFDKIISYETIIFLVLDDN